MMRKDRAHSLLQHLVAVQLHEALPVLRGFGALFCVLVAYFLAQPIRDNAAASLGTQALAPLFTASFVVTACVVPLASRVLQTGGSPARGVRRLFSLLSLSFLGIFGLYALSAGSEGHRVQMARKLLHAAFYLWLSVVNLVAVSTVWARLADVFPSTAATRLFGFLGAGSTLGEASLPLYGVHLSTSWTRSRLSNGLCNLSTFEETQSFAQGQLVGSLLSAAWNHTHRGLDPGTRRAAVLQVAPLLLSAALLECAGRLAASLALPAGNHLWQDRKDKAAKDSPRGRGQLLEGFSLTLRSPYLRHICLYLVLSSIVSSFLYFEKTLVVAASAKDAAGRMTLFALLNSTSASLIFLLQVSATGTLLSCLGLGLALALSPAVAGLLMMGVFRSPGLLVVGGAEVLRKVVNYALSRPAREVLFTVVGRRERYTAKLVLDTLVLRTGDVAAAGMFHLLHSTWGLGPSGCGLAVVPVCFGCAAVAYTLSGKQAALAVRQQDERLADVEEKGSVD